MVASLSPAAAREASMQLHRLSASSAPSPADRNVAADAATHRAASTHAPTQQRLLSDARSAGTQEASNPQQQQQQRRLQGATSQVGGSDLKEVVSPLPYPFSALGLLVFGDDSDFNATAPDGEPEGAALAASGAAADARARAEQGRSICTGFLVNEDTVITAVGGVVWFRGLVGATWLEQWGMHAIWVHVVLLHACTLGACARGGCMHVIGCMRKG